MAPATAVAFSMRASHFSLQCFTDKPNVATLALGSRLRQKGITRVRAKEEARELSQEEARESRRKEARESHHILPGVQESARECEKVLESVRE